MAEWGRSSLGLASYMHPAEKLVEVLRLEDVGSFTLLVETTCLACSYLARYMECFLNVLHVFNESIW